MREDKRSDGGMSAAELALALAYIPVHLFALPYLIALPYRAGRLDATGANLVCYAVGAVYMLLALHGCFKRGFYSLCDYGPRALLDILKGYGFMLLGGIAVSLALALAGRADNPNNAAVFSMAGEDPGRTAAIAVFLAPLVEEPMFRGGVFGLLRRRSRAAAYAVSTLLFAVYHVWGYLGGDAANLLYLLQYLPAGLALARCREKTDSIWTPIFLHMLSNGVSMLALSAMRG